ncbi:helix-turn-helix transcriptional regulator [Alkaliphilus peptidifermentans]|uniref:Helix-turn-helix domain-containing protein n=1 Tax=Alkaliphilus peptidifermentans DSM 18978 TaxID=1120976 RepID=A0A1G5JR45_9FIRM|nr:AraC family transcriptional regulator [Alkaliphilus peptidifermentans]SCY90865.1 Helix-turn-helix domain-containing protein [Alkaliphilus peptidifermentans DSM 18978]
MLYEKIVGHIVKGPIPPVPYYSNDLILLLRPNYFINAKATFKDYYHLTILFQDKAPSLIIDGKSFSIPPQSSIIVNPGQMAESSLENIVLSQENKEYTVVFLDKRLFNQLSTDIGKGQGITFDNTVTLPNQFLSRLLQTFMFEHALKQPGYQLMLDTISYQLGTQIIRSIPNNLVFNTSPEYKASKEIKKVIDYMHEHNNEKLLLNDLCNIAHLSPYYFIKIFKSQTGKTPREYYIDIKLEKARRLLRDRSFSVAEVAYMVGFSSQSYFSSAFKKKIGYTPLEYQKHLNI